MTLDEGTSKTNTTQTADSVELTLLLYFSIVCRDQSYMEKANNINFIVGSSFYKESIITATFQQSHLSLIDFWQIVQTVIEVDQVGRTLHWPVSQDPHGTLTGLLNR